MIWYTGGVYRESLEKRTKTWTERSVVTLGKYCIDMSFKTINTSGVP